MLKKLLPISVFMLVFALPAGAQEIKLATLAPDGSNWMNEMRAAAEQINEQTQGQVRIRFYPGGVMGDASSVLRRMRLGQLHGGAFTLGDLAGVAPAANLYSLPFMFETLEEIESLREEFDPLIIERLAESGIVAPAIGLGGFAYLFSRQPLPQSESDTIDSSLRIWVPASDDLSRRTLEKAGTSPVPLPLAEVYTALQTGAINTFATTPSGAIILQWHTRARYMLDMPLLMTAGTVGLDARTVDRLDDAHRNILMSAFADALGRIESAAQADNDQALAALQRQGIEFIVPDDAQTARWHELAARTREEAVAAGTLKLPQLDRLQERLGELRASQ